MIKAISEHASVGLDEHSLVTVTGESELRSRLQEFQRDPAASLFRRTIHRRTRVQHLAAGQCGGCQVLPPAEIDFSTFPAGKPRLVGYRAKWDPTTFEFHNTPRRFGFPPQDGPLVERIGELARACWDLFGLGGYVRVDFRVDPDGQPWILEVNTNPCLSPDAGFAAALQQAGIGCDEAVARILNDALKR